MAEHDDLTLFSAEELIAGLARLGTRENAEEIAGLVDAIPASERSHYRWSHEAVLLVSSVGPEVAERVRHYYGQDEETRSLIAEQQEHIMRFLTRVGELRGDSRYSLEGVVIDVRLSAPANFIPAYVAPSARPRRRTFAEVASEEELSAALSLLTTEDGARKTAAEVYAIPVAEQVHYDWINHTLMLLSCVSDELAERVLACFAATPEQREELARQQRSFAAFLRTRGASRLEGGYAVDDVVYDVRTESDVAEMS
jgi:hypothetical protein